MADKDLHTRIFSEVAFNTALIGSNGVYNGNIIDTFEYNSLTFTFMTGQTAAADGAVTLFHDDDAGFGTAVPVPSDYVIGTLPSFVNGNVNLTKSVGYVGHKRYVRPVLTVTNHAGPLGIYGLAVKGNKRNDPTQ